MFIEMRASLAAYNVCLSLRSSASQSEARTRQSLSIRRSRKEEASPAIPSFLKCKFIVKQPWIKNRKQSHLASGLCSAARCRMSNHPLTGDPKSSLNFLASSEMPTPSLTQSMSPRRACRLVGKNLRRGKCHLKTTV